MKNNIVLKLLSSLPIILIALYFIPFLGVCLIFLRYLVCNNQKKRRVIPIILIVVGIVLLIPIGLNSLTNLLNIDTSFIPYFDTVINSELYSINFIKYSKFLLTLGVIFLIISFLLNKAFFKLENFIYSYLSSQEQTSLEISEKNDLIMKEKREKAKNTRVVHCPHCGADTMLTSKIGTCKYCRRKITDKES